MEKNAQTLAIANSLKQYFKTIRMSQAEIAAKLGSTQQLVSAYLSGSSSFGKNTARKWSELFGFRVNYLLTGEGEMFENSPTITTNNTSGGDMIINSPNTSIQKNGEDLRVYKQLYEDEKKENFQLRLKILKLMDKLNELGIPCDCS